MKVLVFGGTGFLGIHLVESLVNKGHDVVLFNRGISKNHFPYLRTIQGDRLVSHDALRGEIFDAVIDSNGRNPRAVLDAKKILRRQVGHYSFISSISAYDALQGNATNDIVLNEESKLAPLSIDQYEDQSIATYGGRKAECERLILEECQGDALIIRPGLIVGPGDTTDRFTYWPLRYDEGGDILAPGTGEDNVQIIDVRDLSEWMVTLLEKSILGTFNAISPPRHVTMKSVLAACAAVTQTKSETFWVDQSFLSENSIRPWSDMPTWAPGLLPISAEKAIKLGLSYRPLTNTAKDTLLWARKQNLRRPLQAGLTLQREKDLLTQWAALNSNK